MSERRTTWKREHRIEHRYHLSFLPVRIRAPHRLLQILQGQVGVELGAGDLGMP